MPHEILQKQFVGIDYTIEMIILAVVERKGTEALVKVFSH